MDRVDRWLNTRLGWRRILIAWLVLAPMLLDLGLLWSAYGNIHNQPTTVPTGSMLLHVAVAAVAGIPLAAVLAKLHRWGRKSRPWAPGFSWRMIIAFYIYVGGMCADSYGMTRTPLWQQQHISFKALLLSDAVAGALFIWSAVYYRKLRRRAEADAQPAGS